MGIVGAERLKSELSTSNPRDVIKRWHSEHSLKVSVSSQAPLEFLDALGVSRADAYGSLTTHLREQLISQLSELSSAQLDVLLEQTFPFISMEELQAVPFAVMSKHPHIPSRYLTELASNKKLYAELPIAIKRQIWQRNTPLFEAELRPLFAQYCTAVRSTESGSNLSPKDAAVLRKKRASHGSIVHLAELIGSSSTLYSTCVNFLRQEYSTTRDPTLCDLRTDLLGCAHQVHKPPSENMQ